MKESLETLREEIVARVGRYVNKEEIDQLRAEYLGRKGKLTLMLRGLKEIPAEERPLIGDQLNRLRHYLEEEIETKLKEIRLQEKGQLLREERIDISLPGSRLERGSIHPLTLVMDEIIDVFLGMGFEIARGPDIEDDYHNFEALNIPKDHPARDMQDTFFVSDGRLLRTHTSPVQIRVMESRQPPLQIIAPGGSLSARR